MPLIANTDGVKAKISASVGQVDANVKADVQAVKAGVTGRLLPTMKFVPLRLDGFSESDGFTVNGRLYVDDGKKGYQLGLDTVKRMNTKIVYSDDLNKVDMSKLVEDDYIYLKKDRS